MELWNTGIHEIPGILEFMEFIELWNSWNYGILNS